MNLPNIQDGPTLGTITCADDLVLDDVAKWVAEYLAERRSIQKFYDLAKRGFWVGEKFVAIGDNK
jgi:hypothetical protein